MDWDYISSVVPEDLNEDEKDQLFNVVTWYDSDLENSNFERISILLKISQELLKYKGEQVETLLHELDEVAIKQGEDEARKFESDTEMRSPRSRKSSSLEIENLEQRYNELKSKYKKQQRVNEKHLYEIESLKKKAKSLEHEKNRLEQDLQTSKHDGSSSSDTSDTVRDQQKELVETVHSKNKQISDLLQDIEEVERDNVILREKLASVRDELAVATSEIQSQSDKLKSFDLQVTESQDIIQRLTVDNELLQEEIQELTTQKNSADVRLAEFTKEINNRIEEWQKVLDQKDAEITDLKVKTSEISRQSSSSSYDVEQTHLSALQKLVSERDAHLMEVQSKLEEAVKEMETSTAMIEDLKREKVEMTVMISEFDTVKKELKKQLKLSHERGQKLQEEVEFAEKLAEGKTDELQQVIKQLKEDGHLDEAQILEEMQEIRALNRLNEKQISNLVKNINKLQDNNDQMIKENYFLREQLGISEEEVLSLPNYQTKYKHYKKELLRLKKKVLQFEEENINLRTELKNSNRMNAILQEQLNEADLKVTTESRRKHRIDFVTKADDTDEQRSLDELDRVIDGELSLSIGEIAPEEKCDGKERKMFAEEITNLCEENEALRKGMHEILNSLNAKKESSLREIKSETFEKLLRALDVKHISGWYHPAIRLQAEVHNVEGINKELREQLRMSRKESEELRNEKQESLILLSKRSSVSSPGHLVQSVALRDMKTLDNLNENVDQLIERTEEDVQVCQEITTKMMEFTEQFSLFEKQLEDIYKQSLEEKRAGDEKMSLLESKNAELDCDIQALETKLRVFAENRQSDDAIKEIAELSAENVRSTLKQKYLEDECKKFRTNVDDLRAELLKAEMDLAKRTLLWARNDKALRNKIEIQEAGLDGSLGYEEHKKVKKDLENLTIKFRELVQDCQKQSDNNQMEISMMRTSKQMCDDEKLELKNKLIECLSELEARPVSEPADEHVQALSKKLSQCEVDVVGERQRANHINSLYELVKEQLRKSEERFGECEGYAKEIVRKNLVLQGQLKEAEDKLCDFVDLEIYNEIKKEREKVLSQADELAAQIGKLKEELQIALTQTATTNLWTSNKEEELLALKHQVVDLLSQSDDKAVIARIGADLTQSRAAESELRHKYQVISAQLEQNHDEWLNSLEALDKQSERFEARERYLKKKNRLMQDLLEKQKLQYHGCVPLISEQKFVENMKVVLENNHSSFLSLFKAQRLENESLVLKELAEAEKKHFLDAQKIQKGNDGQIRELLDWLQEKKHVELDLIRFRRQAEFKEIQLQQCNQRIEIQNDQIAKLEEDLFLSHRDMDVKSLMDDYPKSKVQDKLSEEVQEEFVRFPKNQEVQTEEFHIEPNGNIDDETKRCESLKIEVMGSRKELEAKEEVIQQLRMKLNECEMNVSLFRKQIGDKQAQISFYEKHILDLQQQTKKEDGTSQRTQNDGGGDNLRNASSDDVLALKATMKALQDTIVLKEESILQYQSLLKEDRDNHSLAAARMQEEVKMLKNSLAEEKQKKIEYDDPTSEYSRSKAAIDQYVNQVHALEKHADELHTQVSTLESQLQASMQEAVRWRSLANDRLEAIDEMRKSLEEQHEKELSVYKKDTQKWREEVLSLKDLINQHKNELSQVQPDLEDILTAKEDQIQELTDMVLHLRNQLQAESENGVLDKMAEIEKTREQAVKENEALKKRFEMLLRRERSAKEEIRTLKGQLMKNKTPLSAAARSERSDRSVKEQLQKKNAALEEEIVRLKNELSAQVAINESHRVKISEDFDRWKKQKQSQQTIERLRAKLNEKEAEMEKKDQTCSGYRSLIDRLEREKHSLENRIKAMKSNVNMYAMGNTQQAEVLTAENIQLSAEIEELKAKLEIQQRHAGGLGAVMLQEKLEAQERKLAVMELSGKGTGEIRAEIERQQCTISNLQKSNLFLEARNIELKMDLEKTQKDFPRFKEQIQHLENYIDVLKTERDKSARTSSSSVTQIPKTGQESRRVSELERTVLILKRVVEKLQTDNKRLMSAKRPSLERAGSGEKLRKDFQRLKEQYEVSLRKISELQAALNSTSFKLREVEERSTDPEKLLMMARELDYMRAQLEQKTQLLEKVKVLLHRAATKEKILVEEIRDLRKQFGNGGKEIAVKDATGSV